MRLRITDEPFADQYEDDPKSWNLFSYARNNPLNLVDPSGEASACPDGKLCYLDEEENVTSVVDDPNPIFVHGIPAPAVSCTKQNPCREIPDSWESVVPAYGSLREAMWNRRCRPESGGCDVGKAIFYFYMTAAELTPVGVAMRVKSGVSIAKSLCFVEGTLILTEDGLKPIEEIKEGDTVLSYNENTKQTEYKTVVQTMVREAEAGRIWSLKIEGEAKALGVTGEHPFYMRIHRARDNTSAEDDDEGEWIEAKRLQIGDEIRTAEGGWAKVESVTKLSDGATVYNFEVEDNHNYFVGQSNLLVHNNCFKTIGNGLKNFRQIASGRLKGFVRGNTNLPGGNQAARETFKELTGRYPNGSFDRVVSGGKEVMYRGASDAKSGVPKLDIVDTTQKTVEKISFTP